MNPEDSTSTRTAVLYARSKAGDFVPFEIEKAQPRRDGRYKGQVYLLVDRHSYSNAASVAAIVQDYRFRTVVGEETAIWRPRSALWSRSPCRTRASS